jgi:uncharacterized protein (DUF885 family)
MMRLWVMLGLGLASAFFILPLMVFGEAAGGEDRGEEGSKLRAYLEADWKRWMEEYPEIATQFGFPGQDTRWTNDSPAGIASRKQHLAESIEALNQFQRDVLPDKEKLNFDLYKRLLEESREGLQYGDDTFPFRSVVPRNLWMPINQMEGIQQSAPDTLTTMPHRSAADYEIILQRMQALPVVVDQNIALLKEGLKRGYTPPKITLRDVPKQIADLIPAEPLKSALLQAFTEFSAGMTEGDRKRLTARAEGIYTAMLVPAFQKLHDYFTATYLPGCRESIAATALPSGAPGYGFHVQWQTTTTLTPAQIHEIGLAEVKRIRAEMDQVIASTAFKGSFHDFTEFLRTDPQFYYDRADDLVNGYRVIAKRIDAELAHEVGKLPRLTYGVCPIPDFKAPSQTTAYYQPGSPAVGRPGCYFVNTYNLHARPKWEMEALTLHEAVPGHHLQIALAQEQEGVPEFRKQVGYSAYVEGWALYSESLGEEVGLLKDPYSKFGQLTYEMWRAVRLVVDTGMHSMGWTREQSIQFFKDNTGKTDQDITVEVDRYIVWPGQALAYKLGQLEIRKLRNEAEKKLGANFDVRKFHDAVLENGALPLNVLKSQVMAWLGAQAIH